MSATEGQKLVGQMVRDIRAKRGLGQETLARSAGVSPTTLGNFERGVHWPRVTTLGRIEQALKLPAGSLAGHAHGHDRGIQPGRHPYTREICRLCGDINRVGFTVPDRVWLFVVQDRWNVLCLRCFTRIADEMLVEWDRHIEFWPVSHVTFQRESLGE